jgi:hypothetical protein
METLWMFPLYIVIPLVAITFIIIGLVNKSKNKIIGGLFLLVLPFLHGLLIYSYDLDLKSKLAGNYSLNSNTPMLILNDDGTFYLKQSINYRSFGKGNWDIEAIDSEYKYVHLEFDNSECGDLSFEVEENHNSIELKDNIYFNRIVKID